MKDKEFGNGTWITSHLIAAWSISNKNPAIFCNCFRFIVSELPCDECRKHATNYLNSHPPEHSPNCFNWLWEFHNFVNKRLNKPEITLAEADKLFIQGYIKELNDDRFGNGVWVTCQFIAKWADTNEKQKLFNIWIRYICQNLPKYRDISEFYIQTHPPENSIDPFVWMFEFHNFINDSEGVGKPVLLFTTVRDLFYFGQIKNCDSCGSETLPQKINIPLIRH